MLLSSEEIRKCKRKIDVCNQIIFGVMIAYFKTYIKFPSNKNYLVSSKLISQVIDELETNESNVVNFEWEGRTVERYRGEIKLFLGYWEATNNDSKQFIKYLLKDILLRNPSKDWRGGPKWLDSFAAKLRINSMVKIKLQICCFIMLLLEQLCIILYLMY